MAIPAVNASYYLGPAGSALAAAQVPSQSGISGVQSKALVGAGTFVLDGATTTGLTLNFIDGTQKIFQQNTSFSALNITAPATIGGVANQAVISGVGAFGALKVGQSVTIAGFANSANNGAFTVNVVSTSSITVTNASSVAETNNPSATVTYNYQNAALLGVQAQRAIRSIANVADTAATTITAAVTNVTDTAITLTISAAGTNLQTLTVFFEAFPVA